jgi:hypothetical protein
VLELPQALRRGLFCGKRHDQDTAAVLHAAIMGELRAFPEGLQSNPKALGHGVLGGLSGACGRDGAAAIAMSGIGN